MKTLFAKFSSLNSRIIALQVKWKIAPCDFALTQKNWNINN